MTIAVTWDGGSGFNPSFSLPLLDSGAGAVNTAALMSMGSGTPTFTRATTAWTKLSTGLWASVASGTARSSYLGADTTVGAYGGYLAEGARTNNAIQSRAWTNAAWVASNVTVAQTQTGIDGVTNSAASLTASAGNGTVLQTITLASQDNVFQPFVKRLTGTGEIDITLDNGVTWTNITSQINASTFTQVQATKTAANPVIGFRIVTNTDAIAVDMGDMQNGTFASTPIPTTTVAVTRNADVLTYASAGNISASVGTVYMESSYIYTSAIEQGTQEDWISGGTGGIIETRGGTQLGVYDGGGTDRIAGTAFATPSTTVRKYAASWTSTVYNLYEDGVLGNASPLTIVGGINLGATLYIGAENGGGQRNGTIRNLRIYPTALTTAQLQAMTT